MRSISRPNAADHKAVEQRVRCRSPHDGDEAVKNENGGVPEQALLRPIADLAAEWLGEGSGDGS
jgi:hypothetical protein